MADSYQAAYEDIVQTQKKALKLTPLRTSKPITDKSARFSGFRQGVKKFHVGQQIAKGGLKLPSDLVMHESVPTTLSDGTTLYSDIFLPPRFTSLEGPFPADNKVPALLVWSPYGKQVGALTVDDHPLRVGIPRNWLSGLEKFEGPDPAFWCPHEYAVINIDSRGAYTSDGDLLAFGYQEAHDAAEVVTWLSKQPWCNGKVAPTGNSWLAIIQWSLGSLRPEGLAALAPWEGVSDQYRQAACKGGIPDPSFSSYIFDMLVSQNKIEDIHEAINKYPLWNSYWEDKKPRPDWINVPTYAVASWTHVIHSPGTIQAFAKIPKDTPKWLRVHNAMEWYDYYTDSSTQDLKRFFDYYLHGKDNGWLSTPPVRLSILNFGTEHKDMINRPEQEWPLARTQYQKLYLNDDKLAPSSDGQIESFVSYDAIKGAAVFRYTIPEDMETTGNFVAHLVMSCEGADDMDVHIQVETLKEHTHARLGTQTVRPENRLLSWVIDNLYERQIALSKVGALYDWGTNGKLRASHAVDRHPDFTPTEPVYTHKRTVPLKEGERRVLDIPLQPYGMYWKKGQILQLTVAGQPPSFKFLPVKDRSQGISKGTHIIHTADSGEDSSCLIIPVVEVVMEDGWY